MALQPGMEIDTDTRSVLHIVEENFMKLGLKTYAERMMYTGEHTLPREEFIDHIQKTIVDVNSGYCDIPVRGLLLVYRKYFVHVIEGSEDTIHRHLRFLFSREAKLREHKEKQEVDTEKQPTPPEEENGAKAQRMESPGKSEWNMFKRLKLLMVYHSIKTVAKSVLADVPMMMRRLNLTCFDLSPSSLIAFAKIELKEYIIEQLVFKDWNAVLADPPILISKLDVNGPLSEHMEQLRICLDKIRRLGEIARCNDKFTLDVLLTADPKMETLPEVDLLDYLLDSPHLLDLRAVAAMHRRVDHYTFYFEKVWPLPTQYTPRLLYKLKIDDTFVEPLPLMSWEITKEPEEDEKEAMSNSSD